MILEFIVGDRASNIAKIPRDPAKKRRFSPRQQLSSRQPRHVSLSPGPIIPRSRMIFKVAGRNSKTSGKIRRISRTVRRIDSGFRGRCYEMDPCTARRGWEEARRRNERKRKRDRVAERGLECRQATLLLATNVLFLRPLTAPLPSPIITSTNIQAIAFPWSNSRAHRAATTANSMESAG